VGDYYKIINVENGYCINAWGATSTNTAVYTGSDSNLWEIVDLGNGYFKVVSKQYGSSWKPLDVYDGNPIVLYSYQDNDYFKWQFETP